MPIPSKDEVVANENWYFHVGLNVWWRWGWVDPEAGIVGVKWELTAAGAAAEIRNETLPPFAESSSRVDAVIEAVPVQELAVSGSTTLQLT